MTPDQNDIVFDQFQIDFVALFRMLYELLGGSGFTYDSVLTWLDTIWSVFTFVSLILATILLFGLIYAYIRNNQMGALEEEFIANQERLYRELYQGDNANTRWQEVEQHLDSNNPNDWKLAIIEADVMLEEMLNDIGYAGATIGEKLKSASPNNFQTLDDAWKAHKVRNQIAHSGSDFVLTKRAAQDTITMYRRVFQEFGVV